MDKSAPMTEQHRGAFVWVLLPQKDVVNKI
jgi:hypothetical protein